MNNLPQILFAEGVHVFKCILEMVFRVKQGNLQGLKFLCSACLQFLDTEPVRWLYEHNHERPDVSADGNNWWRTIPSFLRPPPTSHQSPPLPSPSLEKQVFPFLTAILEALLPHGWRTSKLVPLLLSPFSLHPMEKSRDFKGSCCTTIHDLNEGNLVPIRPSSCAESMKLWGCGRGEVF